MGNVLDLYKWLSGPLFCATAMIFFLFIHDYTLYFMEFLQILTVACLLDLLVCVTKYNPDSEIAGTQCKIDINTDWNDLKISPIHFLFTKENRKH